MRIVGIDVAPGKKSHVFEGEERVKQMDAQSLKYLLDDLKKSPKDVLIAWDAPLTGPTHLAETTKATRWKGDFTQRPIEAFFMRGENKPPEGVSVQGYAGCQHWTISRYLLGLPRVGRYDQREGKLPFSLVTSDVLPPKGKNVVEVHPALALWLWLKGENGFSVRKTWQYKKNDVELRGRLWKKLCEKAGRPISPARENVPTDDEIDAVTAWLLAQSWVSAKKALGVSVLGNEKTGALLLPKASQLKDGFDDFIKREVDAPSGRR
jgi:predicted nuclease with RNAse H fold